jgi:hypothetical protein
MKICNALCVLLAAIVAACGEGSSTPQSTTAEGLWIGNTSTLRKMTGLVLDDGTFWIFYTGGPGRFSTTEGFIQGTGTSRAGSFSSSNGQDFNFAGLGINNVTVSASFQERQSFNGLVSYPAQGVSFTSEYRDTYEQAPSLDTIAGTYDSGFSINSSGVMRGEFSSGCRFEGNVSPRKKGNVYDLSLTHACAAGTTTATGIGYYNPDTKIFYAAAIAGNGSPLLLVNTRK